MPPPRHSTRKRPILPDQPLTLNSKRQKKPISSEPPVIDAACFPHIIEAIVRQSPYQALLALRTTSKDMRDLVDRRLAHHVVLSRGKEPSSAAGRMPALGADSCEQDHIKEKLSPFTRVLDVESAGREELPINSWNGSLASNTQVLRIHTPNPIPPSLLYPSPKVVVYTRAAMSSSKLFGRQQLPLLCQPLPSGIHKVVLNVPWSRSDNWAKCSLATVKYSQDLVFIFTFTPQFKDEEWVQFIPDIVGHLLRSYSWHAKDIKKDNVSNNEDKPIPSLTLVDPPFVEILYDSSSKVPMKNRRAMILSWLENRLLSPSEHGALTDSEVDDTLNKVKILSLKEYRATLSHEQYILETRLRARDCFLA